MTTSRLRLFQLISPALPVGAFSYSEGLEVLVQRGLLLDGAGVRAWLVAELQRGTLALEAASLPGLLLAEVAELREKIWPSTVFVDFDRGLNSAINRLRHALEDAADAPKFKADVPASILTPDSVKTRLGTLRFIDGAPDDATAKRSGPAPPTHCWKAFPPPCPPVGLRTSGNNSPSGSARSAGPRCCLRSRPTPTCASCSAATGCRCWPTPSETRD